MLNRTTRLTLIGTAIMLGLIGGCDDRAAEVAREAADRQARQNAQMAELQQEVASGTRSLVAADGEARQQLVDVHRDLQAERTRLDRGWNDLETQRQRIAHERLAESGLVAVTKLTGGLAVVIALLSFCWYALVSLRANTAIEDAELGELLIREVTAERSQLLPADTSLFRLARPNDPSTGADQSRPDPDEP